MDTIGTRETEDKITVYSGVYSLEFDTRYGEKQYPFICNLYNVKLSDDLISKIESSKIVKVDPEFSCYSQSSGNSTLYMVPKFGYSLDRIMLVFYNLIKELTDEYQKEY